MKLPLTTKELQKIEQATEKLRLEQLREEEEFNRRKAHKSLWYRDLHDRKQVWLSGTSSGKP